MRIIAGIYGRRIISAPDSKNTKPTPDRVRENLFNILRPDLQGARFLDLFACSGAIGIEALSRGAEYAVFCDKSREAVKTVSTNLASLKVPASNYRILHADFISALRLLKGDKFNIIFMDPPFSEGLYEPALKTIASLDLLAKSGTVVCEHRGDITVLPPEGFTEADRREYGIITLSFFQKD